MKDLIQILVGMLVAYPFVVAMFWLTNEPLYRQELRRATEDLNITRKSYLGFAPEDIVFWT